MAAEPLKMTSEYREFVRGIRELHRLALAGRDDGPEADAIRDGIDAHWELLSTVERERASGLSADLYAISEPARADLLEMNGEIQKALTEVADAQRRGNWDSALELLRRTERYVAPSLLSYLRGSIWRDAGDAETASLFFDHAFRLNGEGYVHKVPAEQVPIGELI
jgi:hypothetical protein